MYRYVIWIGLFCIALPTYGQTGFGPEGTRTLDIQLVMKDCSVMDKIKDIFVVYGDNDARWIPAKQDKEDPCHYTATLDELQFDKTKFSLRLHIGRTDCRVMTLRREKERPFRPYGALSFKFDPRHTGRDLTMGMDFGANEVKYNRTYLRNIGVDDSMDCFEEAKFGRDVEVLDVDFPSETIEVQFSRQDRFFIDEAIQKKMKWDSNVARSLPLSPQGVGNAYVTHLAAATPKEGEPRRSEPYYCAADAGDLIAWRLKSRGFKSLRLTRE